MEKARLATFRLNDSWPHDQVKGHGANSTKARFVSVFTFPDFIISVDGQGRVYFHSPNTW
jgi:hypothetical protein